MPMKNPPHPGGFVLRQCIEPLGLSITAAASALGVTRTTLSELVNEKRGISPEMAVRLSRVFGGSAESWLYSASAVRPCTRSRRPDEAETAGTGLDFPSYGYAANRCDHFRRRRHRRSSNQFLSDQEQGTASRRAALQIRSLQGIRAIFERDCGNRLKPGGKQR